MQKKKNRIRPNEQKQTVDMTDVNGCWNAEGRIIPNELIVFAAYCVY